MLTHATVKPKFKNLGQQHTGPKLQAGNRIYFFFNIYIYVFVSIFPNLVHERKAVQLTKSWWKDKDVKGFLIGEQGLDL